MTIKLMTIQKYIFDKNNNVLHKINTKWGQNKCKMNTKWKINSKLCFVVITSIKWYQIEYKYIIILLSFYCCFIVILLLFGYYFVCN